MSPTEIKHTIWILIVSFSLCTDGLSRTIPHYNNDRIINGENAKIGDFPSQVSVQYLGNDPWYHPFTGSVCGGTILNSLHILTAAHCLYNQTTGLVHDPYNISVMVGDTTVRFNKTGPYRMHYQAILIFVHPLFGSFLYDIGVIRLHTEIEFIKGIIQPATLSTDWLDSTAWCSLSGWGYIENKTITYDLKKIDIPYIDQNHCRMAYGARVVFGFNFCAGFWYSGFKNSDEGDSGGGLYCGSGDANDSVYGIVSFGSKIPAPLRPTVFTNVTSLRSWVEDCYVFKGLQRDIPRPVFIPKSVETTNEAKKSISNVLFVACLYVFWWCIN